MYIISTYIQLSEPVTGASSNKIRFGVSIGHLTGHGLGGPAAYKTGFIPYPDWIFWSNIDAGGGGGGLKRKL